ncbi:MAG: DUF4440 domain-containing protein [Hyphomicrobiaceae bacterium]
MIDRYRTEIEEMHAFIAGWFQGSVAQDAALFEAQFARRLDPALVNIQPSGQVLTRADLLDGIRAGYGGNSKFSIEIDDVALRWADDGLALVTYVEFQRGARNTVPSDNRRISTVLFRDAPGAAQPVWLHIHETGLD